MTIANFSDITIVAVLDNNGELHKINYEQLANLPSAMKNPNALIIFGQKYDGSNEVNVSPLIATEEDVGCVKPVQKTDSMNQQVGIDSEGRLFTRGVEVDAIVTAFSEKPVSSNGVYVYITSNNQQINNTISSVKKELENTSETRYNELRNELTVTEQDIKDLRETATSKISNIEDTIKQTNANVKSNSDNISELVTANSDLAKRVATNGQNIDINTEEITTLKPQVQELQDGLAEVKSRNIGYYFESESLLLQWLSNGDNIKKLGVGVCLYIRGNTSVHYVWNGSSAERVAILSEVVGGYMTAKNPTGTGYISMNDNQTGSYGAVFGQKNIANGAYSLIGGNGIQTQNDCQTGVGRYNATSTSDEMFTVGVGTSDDNRMTAHVITDTGTSKSIGDVTAYDSSLNAPISTDKSKVAVSCSITNKQSNVDVKVDWDSFVTLVTRNDAGVYNFVYKDGHWSSDSYNFAYIAQQETQYYPIDVVGISFAYNDGTEGTPTINFVDNDTITVHAPLQKTISLRELYNTVSELYQYVHKES